VTLSLNAISMQAKERFSLGVMSVLVAVVVGWVTRDLVVMILAEGPAVEVRKYELVSDVLEPGEPLQLKILTERKRHCIATTSRRYVYDKDINASVWSETVDVGYIVDDTPQEPEIIRVKIGLHPQGNYEFRATWQDHCDRGTYTIPLKRLPFRIALKPKS
jgi:hypothetical protein